MRLYNLVLAEKPWIFATAYPDTHEVCMAIKSKQRNPNDWTIMEYQHPVRFFSYCMDEENEPVIVEVTEDQFIQLKDTPAASVTYERHTVHDNGVNQVCLTVETWDTIDVWDLERI
jgi:hypothetical protein